MGVGYAGHDVPHLILFLMSRNSFIRIQIPAYSRDLILTWGVLTALTSKKYPQVGALSSSHLTDTFHVLFLWSLWCQLSEDIKNEYLSSCPSQIICHSILNLELINDMALIHRRDIYQREYSEGSICEIVA